MKIFFYDTETTGLPLDGIPSSDARQPHIVQFAGVLVDAETRRVIHSIDLIARPDGWTIPEEVTRIHGITHEHALDVGVPEGLILKVAIAIWQESDVRVGHNEPFDARIVRIALMRALPGGPLIPPDTWQAGPAECTAALATPIMNLPPSDRMRQTGISAPKRPRLQEAHEFFCGHQFDGAHNAMVDVTACMSVYWAIKDREATSPERRSKRRALPARGRQSRGRGRL